MKHEEIYNIVRMICGSLLMVTMFTLPSCEDDRVEQSLEPAMQLWVNGDQIDPFTYYGQVKKLLVMHFQREVGRVLPELEHYAAIWVDDDGEDNNDLIDAGLYLNYGPLDTIDREQRMDMEIIGSFDYTEFAQSEIYTNDNNKVSGMANGQFYNPYREEMQMGLLIFENIEIGTDPDATFYTGGD